MWQLTKTVIVAVILFELPASMRAGGGTAPAAAAATPRVENIDSGGRATPNSLRSGVQPGGLARFTIAGSAAPRAEIRIRRWRVTPMEIAHRHGALELTFRVPDDAPSGCNVPARVLLGGVEMRDSVPITIGSCEASFHQPRADWFRRKVGVAMRIRDTEWLADSSGETASETVMGAFFEGGADLELGPLLHLPPEGMCATHAGAYDSSKAAIETLLPLLMKRTEGMGLHAGAYLGLDDGHNRVNLPERGEPGLYQRTFVRNPNNPPPIDTGSTLHLRGAGGRDAGRFAVALPEPEEFIWLNRPRSGAVGLRAGLPLKWRARAGGVVLVAAAFLDPVEGELSYCLCAAPASAGAFRIPKRTFASVHASAHGESAGAIVLMHLPRNQRSFDADGLEVGISYSLSMHISKLLFTW